MKKYIILCALVLVFWISAKAQKNNEIQTYIGAYAGVGVGTFNSNLKIEYPFYFAKQKQAGIGFRIFSSRKTALQLEAGYTEKGGLSFYDKNFFGSDTINMNKTEYFVYKTGGIQASALTHLAFGKRKNKFTIAFGPYGYYVMSKKISAYNDENITKTTMPKKNYDLGIKVAIGYGLYHKNNVFEFEIQYAHGFINVYEKNSINEALLNQNQTLILNLAYYKKIKNKN